MKVAVSHLFEPRHRERVAHFLGRPGQLATRAECIAFARQSVDRRLEEINRMPAPQERPKA